MPRGILRDHLRANHGQAFVLYEFDLSLYNQGFYRLVTGDVGDTVHAVSFGGNVYSPWAIKSRGWDVSTSGSLPRPTITIANTGGLLTALVENNNDLRGCTVKRIRTYARFLDDGRSPNVNETKPIDEFIIIQKMRSVPDVEYQFQLASPLDQEGSFLPNQQVHRDYCPYVYRSWNGVRFDYTQVTECPYRGVNSYDENGASTTNQNDLCGKRLRDCKLRFGENAELPYGGFPGVSRIKVR